MTDGRNVSNMTWKLSLLASSLLTLGLVGTLASIEGCSSKGDDATGTPEGACQAYAEASCNRSATCSKTFFASYSSVAQCSTHVAAACQAALALPDTGFSTDAVNACREAMAGAACIATTPAACSDIHGARGEGRPCAEDIQCASGYCNGEADLKCGSCAAVAASGEACDSKKPCGFGLTCKAGTGSGGSGTTGTCVAKLQPGSTCAAGDSCVSPYTCRNGTCSPPAGKGEPCSLSGGNACDSSQGLSCQLGSGGAGGSGTMGTCTEYTFKIAQPGEACGTIVEGTTYSQVLCAGGGTCKQTTGAGGSGTMPTGTCQAALDIGSTCTGNAGAGGTSSSTSYPDGNCSGAAKCVNGTCQIPPYPTCN